MNQLSRLFDRPGDTDAFFKNAIRLIAESFQGDDGFIYLYDEEGGTLTLRAHAADSLPANPDPAVGIRPGVVGEVFRTQQSRRDGVGPDPAGSGADPERNLPRPDLPGFLAAPVRRGPRRIGVLLVQRRTGGSFTGEDERALRAIANPLAATLENAVLLREVPVPKLRESPERPHVQIERKGAAGRLLYGRTASEGSVLGKAFILEQRWLDELPGGTTAGGGAAAGGEGTSDTRQSDTAAEEVSVGESLRIFEEAVEQTRHQLEELHHDSETDLSDVASLIFNSHLLMLGDESFTGEMRRRIREGEPPERAVYEIVRYFAETFERMEDPRFTEKVQDVQDVGHRLISNLQGLARADADYTGYVVIARHVFPSELVKLAVQHVAGVIFYGSGVTAHISILARSLGIPVLVSEDSSVLTVRQGTTLLLDATGGTVYIEPDEETQRRFREKASTVAAPPAPVGEEGGCTDCGEPVQVLANVNILQDVQAAINNRADGVGLYRSEFPFLVRNAALTEEEQYYIYKRILDRMGNRETTLRTADIGGDKLMDTAYQPEQNPFLGVRGIRFSLANTELFRDQLRAMLRAGVGRDLRIMFPMVSSVEEVEEGRSEIRESIAQLEREGVPHNPAPRIGAMIELPSAVEAVAELAEATDFLSIGTNDLVMYLLAVDRTNERLGNLYRNYHPAVLRALKRIVDGVGEKISELSLCGDSAADPTLIPFFVGTGIRKLSVAPKYIGRVREQIASLTIDRARTISREMLSIRGIREMEQYLAELSTGRERMDGPAGASVSISSRTTG
ncbi:MAG: phosphoenolpyruvate--protein phosphotransferase [bacterium]